MNKTIMISMVSLRAGAEDFRYLLNRRYPRKQSLELVGNRYDLRKNERELLHRGVFAHVEAMQRKQKLLDIRNMRGVGLGIDGHNVVITVEAALRRQPLVRADDGLLRDISGLSSAYKVKDVTLKTVDLIMEVLRDCRPERVVFLFDAPMSRSGQLASYVADCLKAAGLAGEAQAVKVPEKVLYEFPGAVATSDCAIIDTVGKVVDLAGCVIRRKIPTPWIIDI